MAQKFRTKIVEIEATRWTGDNLEEMVDWTEGNFREFSTMRVGKRLQGLTLDQPDPTAQVYDKLHTTWINVLTGQWIVRGAKGEYYPCDDETFHWKYEEVNG